MRAAEGTELKYTVEDLVGGIREIKLEGEIDADSNHILETIIREEITAESNKIILNLQLVGYTSSVGLGTIVYGVTHARKLEGDFIICSVKEQPMKEIFDLVGLSKLTGIYETREQAIAHYSGTP